MSKKAILKDNTEHSLSCWGAFFKVFFVTFWTYLRKNCAVCTPWLSIIMYNLIRSRWRFKRFSALPFIKIIYLEVCAALAEVCALFLFSSLKCDIFFFLQHLKLHLQDSLEIQYIPFILKDSCKITVCFPHLLESGEISGCLAGRQSFWFMLERLAGVQQEGEAGCWIWSSTQAKYA